MAHVLIVDDEESICWGINRIVGELGHTATSASSAEEGLDACRAVTPDVVFLDVRLPGRDGLSAMRDFQELIGAAPIIVITAYGDLNTAVRAVQNGAFEYLVKPFDLEVAERTLERAVAVRLSSGKATVTEPSLSEDKDQLIGKSPTMQEIYKRIALAAASNGAVHIRGESGTGKELIARAIHRHSRRADGPFVPAHLASLSANLAESELFGHVRGAFTGAEFTRIGLLERANGGTLFLDEVADIPASLQVKLLRALEQGEFWPVGSDHPTQSDFRIISATHQDLHELVAEARFRHDLLYRLMTFQIDVPTLRERTEDLPELASHFLQSHVSVSGSTQHVLTQEALDELKQRPWHGNVRELRNAIEHALVVCPRGPILPSHLPPPAPMRLSAPPGDVKSAITENLRRWTRTIMAQPTEETDLYEQFLALVEPAFLEEVLQDCNGQYSSAARRLGLHRTTLKKKLDQSIARSRTP